MLLLKLKNFLKKASNHTFSRISLTSYSKGGIGGSIVIGSPPIFLQAPMHKSNTASKGKGLTTQIAIVPCLVNKYEINGDSAWTLAPVWPGVYAWKLPGVTGNAWNGLIFVVALQLVAVAYGVNLFSEPLEDLEGCMVKLLECLRNPGYRLGM
eukprot:Gb_34335 [translate_table: standard]